MTESNFSRNSLVAQEQEFEQQAVSIGSHADNDIVLVGPGVLPFHATAVVDGEYCSLIPMEPEAEILVDGVALGGMPAGVEGFQQVEIGSHVLFFQRSGTAMRVLTRAINEKAAAQYTADNGESIILLNVFSGEAEIDVEQTAVYEFEVVNAGPIVASFYVTVKGCPTEWVEISPDTINLNEGQRRNVEIKITPPRDPSSYAGTHAVEVIVHSPNYGGQLGQAELSLAIHPYYEYALGNLSPKNQRIYWRKRSGMTYLPITNMSNGPADFSLMAMDDENGCTFDFCLDEEVQLSRQATTKLGAGETAEVPIQITPTKNPMFSFRSKRYHYTTNVSIPQNPGAPQVLSGSATSVPLFGWWSIMLTIAAFVIAAFFVLQPNIRSFDVAAGKDVIELGDTTKLLWDVSPFATRLSISNVDEPINRGQFSRTVAPEASTTYELVSGNWLSGMFGLDQKQSVTVLVVPPTPAVNVFEVDETTIAKGKPINVRWSVKEADEAFLTIDEVVYPLTKEEFSGEQQVVLEKDALVTLEARNASGSELQSYFVNVVPPYIDINIFTVWVRPDDGTTVPAEEDAAAASVSGAGKMLMSKTTAPDPNFPVKFVELVADPNSETGYRVVFNPNVREELQKGEQVILEWNVAGVESLEIAPFTDSLPSHGSQPAFPQESMNFVMTAQSGELQGIYMLPIKVFDGQPPEAPTIEFFTASPSKMVGAGDSEFAWSVSGEWTRIQISSGEEIIADYLNAQGFKTISIDKTKNILLTAWNGELSSSKIIEVVVDPALIPLNLEITDIQDHSGFFYVGDIVQVFIDFSDPALPDPAHPGEFLPPSPYPTGTVTVSDGFATCIIELPVKNCPDGFTFNAPGDPTDGGRKTIVASYSGDDIYLGGDSDPYDKQDIVVLANTVKLSPAFFYYYDTDAGVVEGTSEIKPLTDANLNVGDGLFIDVAVTSENGPLAKDDKGQVVARYCPISLTNEVLLNECVRTLPATVKVTEVGGNTIGHATIAIPHLKKVGSYQMLISYSHLDGAYESTLLDNPNNRFDVDKGFVLLLSDGLDGCTTTDCKIIARKDEALFFFGELVVNGEQTPLFATYPQPEDRNAQAFSLIYTPTSTGIPDDWSDNCSWSDTGGIWRLECDPITIGVDGVIAFTFQDENYTGSLPIAIQVKEATEIEVLSDFEDVLTGKSTSDAVYVGETIDLQMGKIFVREREIDPLTGPVILSGVPVFLAMDNGNDIGNFLRIVGTGNTCFLENGRLRMSQSATLLSDHCYVYFKKAGSFFTTLVFEGNDDYDQTSKALVFNIQKQQIEVAWEDQGGGTLDTSREIFEEITLRLTFTCSDTGKNCDNFSPRSMLNASIHFDLSGVQACDVYQGASLLDDGDMVLPGSLTPAGTGEMIVDDLSLRCKNLGTLTVDLMFADPSDNDFDISVGDGDSQDFEIEQKSVNLNPEVGIYSDTGLTNAITIGTRTEPLGNDSPTANSDDENLWVGEQYRVYASFAMPEDAVPTANDVIVMTLPAAFDALITPVNCQDLDKVANDGIHRLPLVQNTADGVWEVKCGFKPTATHTFINTDVFSFSLNSARLTATDRNIALDGDVAKRPVTIVNAISGGTAQDATNYYALTGPLLQLTFSDEHYQLDAITNWADYLTVNWNTTSPQVTLACSKLNAITIQCTIPDDEVANRTYRVRYEGNDSFADNIMPAVTLNIVPIPVKLVSESGDFPVLVTCQWLNCTSTGLNHWPYGGSYVAFKNTEYTLTLTVDTEPAINEKVQGNIIVNFGSWSACPVTVLDNSGTKTGTCNFLIPIQSNETAVFKWKFTDVVDDRSYTLGYGNDNGSYPFVKGTEGWNPSKTYSVYQWIQFQVSAATCGSEKGFNIKDAYNNDLPLQYSGYYVNAEYPDYGGAAGFSEQYFECEDNDEPCWFNQKIYDEGGGGDEDGCSQTQPNWSSVIDNGVNYQVIVINTANNLLGWILNLP